MHGLQVKEVIGLKLINSEKEGKVLFDTLIPSKGLRNDIIFVSNFLMIGLFVSLASLFWDSKGFSLGSYLDKIPSNEYILFSSHISPAISVQDETSVWNASFERTKG